MQLINFLATDGIQLNGILYESKNATKKIILAVHGMSSNCLKKRDEVIGKKANETNIDYFCFNNRGSELAKYIRKKVEGKMQKTLGGMSYEDPLDGYEDIVGAILKLKELGYEDIYLQGHSLGCTKIVYTYNKLKEENKEEILENIKSIILLSLIDIPMTLKVFLGENFEKYLKLAEEKEKEGNIYDLMPNNAFIHPISVKTFLRYVRDNKEFDFAAYSTDKEFKVLNSIDKPLFMRWGNEKEMILQKAEVLTQLLNENILNINKNIEFIDGADHGYNGKEEILAEQIVEFLK